MTDGTVAALDAGMEALWATYQASGLAPEDLQDIDMATLRRWAAEKGPDNAAAKVLAVLRAEAAAAIAAFLTALPTRYGARNVEVEFAVRTRWGLASTSIEGSDDFPALAAAVKKAAGLD